MARARSPLQLLSVGSLRATNELRFDAHGIADSRRAPGISRPCAYSLAAKAAEAAARAEAPGNPQQSPLRLGPWADSAPLLEVRRS